jgi:HlyD family secretion protein
MRIERRVAAAAAAVMTLLLLAGCKPDKEQLLLGTLEWDRVSVPAEASEPVLRLAVAEGTQVKAGDLLLSLDGKRMDARLAQAQSTVEQQQARLSELMHGARSEQLDSSRAALASAQASLIEATRQYSRTADLAGKQFVARATLDAARASRDRAQAQVAAAQAQLRELTHGTRPEQIAQAEAALDSARSAWEELRLSRARLDVRAPRAGRVDALPFKAGDQPPMGASVASLLVGDAPYARVFIPSSIRVNVREGQKFLVRVQGSERELHATLRSVAREASFTPYYALTGDDASRLVYRAELLLTDAEATALPAGVPVQARLAQ